MIMRMRMSTIMSEYDKQWTWTLNSTINFNKRNISWRLLQVGVFPLDEKKWYKNHLNDYNPFSILSDSFEYEDDLSPSIPKDIPYTDNMRQTAEILKPDFYILKARLESDKLTFSITATSRKKRSQVTLTHCSSPQATNNTSPPKSKSTFNSLTKGTLIKLEEKQAQYRKPHKKCHQVIRLRNLQFVMWM